MYRRIIAGATSQIVEFPVYDSSSSTGALLAGLAYNTASLTAYYSIQNAAGAAVAISLATMTKGTWATSGFVAVDGTNMPGVYQLGIPDLAIAATAGVKFVTIMLKGAANMVPVVLEIELQQEADMKVNVTQILGTAVSTPATAGVLDVNIKNIANAAVNTASAQIGANVVNAAGTAWGSGAITEASVATGAITNAKFAAGAIDAAAIAADAIGASEFAQAAADKVWSSAARTLTAISTTLALSVWDVLTANIVTASSIGKKIIDWLAGTDTSTPTVNLTKIDGNATAGNNATLNLKKLNIINNAGDAIVASSTGSNGKGINASGNGSGAGILATGGATDAAGILLNGGGAGAGLKSQGGATGIGIHALSTGGLGGLVCEGNSGGGYGIYAFSMTTGYPGAYFAALSANAAGLSVKGAGTGAGLKAEGGATGHGLHAFGGATSGDGFKAEGQTLGHGAHFLSAGAGRNGLNSVSWVSGNGIYAGATYGNGIVGVAAGDGYGLYTEGYGKAGIGAYGQGANPGIEARGGATGEGATFLGSGNAPGIKTTGAGNGEGLLSTGGATAAGMKAIAGGANYSGLVATGGSAGHGIIATGVAGGSGIRAIGGDGGHGIYASLSGGSGNGIYATGGATAGDGISALPLATNGNALTLQGTGTGNGLQATGGATGDGMLITGGDGKSGVAIKGNPTGSGNGLDIRGGASAGYGIYVISNGANGDGIRTIGNGSGAGVSSIGGASGNGISATGGGAGRGISVLGGAAGIGLYIASPGTHGAEIIGSILGEGLKITGAGTGSGILATGGAAGHDIAAKELGTVFNIDGVTGAGTLEVLKKIVDDNAGADFDATTDSLEKIRNAVTAAGTSLTSLEVRDAMKLAPSAGAAAAGSIDSQLDEILLDLSTITTDIGTMPADVDTQLSLTHGAGSWLTGGGITAQQTRDAMKLAPSAGAPIAGSIDDLLATLQSDITTIGGLVVTVDGKVDTVDANVDAIVAVLPAGTATISSLAMSTVNGDGQTLDDILQLVAAMVNGKFILHDPVPGHITFYKRDSLTALFEVSVTTDMRERI